MTATLEQEIRARLDKLNPAERRLAEIRLQRIITRKKALRRFPTPGHLAKFVHPDTIQTKLMVELDKVALAADAGMARQWLISTPPQEGKSQRMGTVVPLWLLLRDPSRRIVIASYEQGLSGRSGLAVRQLIETHGGGYKGDRASSLQEDELGLILDPNRAQQTNWNLADVPGRRNGGMVAVGVGSAFTGRSADVLVIDDPVKDAKAADSEEQRKSIQNWYQAVARTRLSGGAIVIVIQTRWHEDDLMGFLIREDDLLATPRWSRVIVPAVAEHHDPLGRAPGEYLTSARGRTPEDWDQIRRDVGERWWAALYLCKPSPPAGGVFKLEWITNNRVKAAPELERTEVFVDPADNEGQGDEAGIIVAGRGADQRYYVLEDASDHMTVGRWLRVAFLAALRWGATAVKFERSLSGLDRRARQAWKDLRREAARLDGLWQEIALLDMAWPTLPTGSLLSLAVSDLARDDASAAERTKLELELLELWPYVPSVIALPVTGIPVRGFSAKGSKTFRAQMISPLYSGNHVSHVGHFPELEHQMVAWQEGQDSPDRMDGNVHALTELSRSAGRSEMSGATGTVLTRTTQSTIPRMGMQGRR
jgi:hypothetical protein